MNFRSDINGLRALAVLPVLFFHAELPLFSGGFLGVDVFFVISGYLITEKLLSTLVSERFAFTNFYDNRIRRIIPALLVVCTCTTALSFLFMVPYSLRNYGQSLFATMVSANNILLYLTSGYWAAAAEFKPLYHTWSLGVEEQYYFVAPLLLYVLYKSTGHLGAVMRGLLAFLLAISLFLAFDLSDTEFKFLLIFTRAWELLAGALLALSANRNRSNPFLSSLGLLLLLTSYAIPYLLGTNQALVTAIPVIGTCLIIRFSSVSNITGRVLSLKPLAFVGLISYSVYLWHQPILAFLRLSSMRKPYSLELLAYSLLSLPLGYLSWRYVENVFRNKTLVPARMFYTIAGIGVGLNLVIGYTLYATYGFQNLTPQLAYGESPQIYAEKPRELAASSFSGTGKLRVLVVGNSFARDYINMMRENGLFDSAEVVYVEGNCTRSKHREFDALLAGSNLVVFSEDWGRLPDNVDLANTLTCYQYMGHKTAGRVVVLGAKNFGWNNDFVKMVSGNLSDIRVAPLETVATFNTSAKALIGENYVDVLGSIADQAGEVPLFTPDEKFITYDSNHLTKAGARYIGERVFGKYRFLVP